MLGISLAMLLSGALMMLRVSPSGSFPSPLSAEEEQKYIRQWQNGDVNARNILVEHNLRLVAHIIKKYYTQTNDMEDLISIGTIGLIKGINTYKPNKGVRLATYASRCCENELLMHFRSQKKTLGDVSLSDVLETDGEGNALSFIDVLSGDDEMSDRIEELELCGKLRDLIKTVLSEREGEIIMLRYGLRGQPPMTQRETAQCCGISRSYVSRIEKKALAKLKAAIGDETYNV